MPASPSFEQIVTDWALDVLDTYKQAGEYAYRNYPNAECDPMPYVMQQWGLNENTWLNARMIVKGYPLPEQFAHKCHFCGLTYAHCSCDIGF